MTQNVSCNHSGESVDVMCSGKRHVVVSSEGRVRHELEVAHNS